MTSLDKTTQSLLIADLIRLLRTLPGRQKWQLGMLFLLQSLSALSEVASLGAIIPFIGALTNINGVISNPYIEPVLSELNLTSHHSIIIFLASVFVCTIVIANTLRFVTLWAQLYLSAKIGTNISTKLFDKTLHQTYSYFIKNNSSELIGNLTNDLNGTLAILQASLTLMTQGLITIAIAVSLFIYNPQVAFALSLIAILSYVVIMALVSRRLRRNSLVQSNSYRNLLKALQEGFGGIRYIITDHSYKKFVDDYQKIDHKHRITLADNNIIRQSPRFIIEAIGIILICSLTILLTADEKNISSVIPFLGFLALASHRLLPALQQIYASISLILGLRISLLRVVNILEQKVKFTKPTSEVKALTLEKALRINDISFDYENGADKTNIQWTLKNINFEIKAKTTVAFVGQTGSGKSTISDIILGLIPPIKGMIDIDGTPLNQENLQAWQKGLSHVPQSIFLIDASIAENIAFGIDRDKIDMAHVISAAQKAEIHEFIQTLPDQYNTLTGERGVKLSGGQIQRIGIARALYKQPSVVVLDEATSALDTDTEKKVMKTIENLSNEITIILIAHRLSTVKKADMIFLFDQGCLVGQGTYNQLLETSDIFRKFIINSE